MSDEIRAQEGPQSKFLSSAADIAIYGGAAGGGKSFALLLEPLYDIENPKFGGVIFRRTSPQLVGAGSLWENAQELYRPLGARLTESPNLDVVFRGGATLEFRHLQHASDVYDHQGKEYAFIGFDELTHFEESQFWYLVSRMRSMSGARIRMRCTTNPDPDSFVRGLVAWWIGSDGLPIAERSGKRRWFIRDDDAMIWGDTREEILAQCEPGQQPQSMTFIGASLKDNPALTSKDPGYEGRINSLPLVERQRLGGGNWDVRPEGGKYIERPYFERRYTEQPKHLNIYICSDYAVSEPTPGRQPDWTEHGVFGISPEDDLCVLDWWHGQTKSDVWIDVLLDKIARWKPLTVFGEQGVIQKAVEPSIIKRMRERKIYARTAWLTSSTSRLGQGSSKQGYEDPSKQAKARRGRAFQARAALKKILFPANAEWADRVMDQCVGFPNGKDDAFDVMSHMCLALSEAHPAILPPEAKPPKKRDYGDRREVESGEEWRRV